MKNNFIINFFRPGRAKIIITIIPVFVFFFYFVLIANNKSEAFWLIPMIIGGIITRGGCLPIVGYGCSSQLGSLLARISIVVGYLLILLISYLVSCILVAWYENFKKRHKNDFR